MLLGATKVKLTQFFRGVAWFQLRHFLFLVLWGLCLSEGALSLDRKQVNWRFAGFVLSVDSVGSEGNQKFPQVGFVVLRQNVQAGVSAVVGNVDLRSGKQESLDYGVGLVFASEVKGCFAVA